MKTIALAFLLLLFSDAWAAENGDTCKDFQFEKSESVPLTDVGRLADTKTSSGSVGTIVLWFFDEEDRPARRGMHALGLVVARSGDIGEEAQGGFLWTTLPTRDVSVQGRAAKGRVILTVKRKDGSHGCERSGVTFIFTEAGLSVQ